MLNPEPRTLNPLPRRGFMLTEAIAAIALVALTTTLLAVALGSGNKAMNRLADTRQATQLAEQALLALQQGADLPAGAKLARLSEPSPVPGQEWVSIRCDFNGRSAELVGLASRKEAKP